jgi:hypothetical protein
MTMNGKREGLWEEDGANFKVLSSCSTYKNCENSIFFTEKFASCSSTSDFYEGSIRFESRSFSLTVIC